MDEAIKELDEAILELKLIGRIGCTPQQASRLHRCMSAMLRTKRRLEEMRDE